MNKNYFQLGLVITFCISGSFFSCDSGSKELDPHDEVRVVTNRTELINVEYERIYIDTTLWCEYYLRDSIFVYSFKKYKSFNKIEEYRFYNDSSKLLFQATFSEEHPTVIKGCPLAFIQHEDTVQVNDTLEIAIFSGILPGSDYDYWVFDNDSNWFLQKKFLMRDLDFIHIVRIVIPDTSGIVDFHVHLHDKNRIYRDTIEVDGSFFVQQ